MSDHPLIYAEAPVWAKLCSRCKQKSSFAWDTGEKDWVSECCHASPVDPSDSVDSGLAF